MSALQNARSWVRRQGAPVTLAILAVVVVSSLVLWAIPGGVAPFLALDAGWTAKPWSLLTYPFARTWLTDPLGILFLIFLIMWTLQAGGSVERDLGAVRYAAFWVGVTALFGLALGVAAAALGSPLVLFNPFLPVAALTVVWGLRNAATPLSFWGIPITGRTLAILDAAIVLFTIGFQAQNPLMGLVALGPLGVAAAFATNRLPGLSYGRPAAPRQTKAAAQRERAYFDDVRRREQERDERERLRKLFESSLGPDDK